MTELKAKVRRCARTTSSPERPGWWPWGLIALLAGGGILYVPQSRAWLMGLVRHSTECLVVTALVLCALLPSALAFMHRVRNNRRHVDSRMEVLRAYLLAARHYASSRGRVETARIFTAGLDQETLEQNRPGYVMLACGAVALTLPFLLVAMLAAVYLFPEAIDDPSVRAVMTGPFQEGMRGLVFAGFGVYVYTLLLIIYRMQAAALSSEFLLSTTLRTLNTLVLGFVAGHTHFFQSIGTSHQSGFFYFILGAFPGWALQYLRRRVVALIQPTVPNQEALSLEYVEGINDRITERLEELGISDIQHLAHADPGELTLRTLYPLALTLDWVDQSRLILLLRDKIGVARLAGVRGAIDMRELFQEAQYPEAEGGMANAPRTGTRARGLLQDLAKSSGLTLEALHHMGARLAEDYQVDFLAYLRNRRSLVGPLPALMEAIQHALEDSGLQTRDEQAVEGRSGGTLDVRKLESAEVRQRFSDRLAETLGKMSLEWTGDFEELREADSSEELYDLLLARIHLKASARSRPRFELFGARTQPPLWVRGEHLEPISAARDGARWQHEGPSPPSQETQ